MSKAIKLAPFQKLLTVMISGKPVTLDEMDTLLGKEIYMYRISTYMWHIKVNANGVIKAIKDGRKVTGYQLMNVKEVKEYMNSVYLDQGYRNRFRLAELLDEIIENKLQEAREAGMYSSKDLVDILALAHKVAEDHRKEPKNTIRQQNNVQINSPFGEGNYGKLMEKLLGTESSGS
jgi:hypothetical protein